jgi:hypothetical protein
MLSHACTLLIEGRATKMNLRVDINGIECITCETGGRGGSSGNEID